MRGFPKKVATKQDFLNLLSMPQFRKQARDKLKKIWQTKDDKITAVVSGSEEEGNLVTEEIPDPNSLWKQKGFKNRKEVGNLYKKWEGK